MTSWSFKRLSAVGTLVIALWLGSLTATLFLSSRLRLSADIADAKASYEFLRKRRVDIATLQRKLASLENSSEVRATAVSAPSGKAALSVVQQIARSAVESSGGKFLSSVEMATAPVAGTIVLQFRARIAEKQVSLLLASLEKNNPQLEVEELQLMAKADRPDTPTDIEVTAAIRARWLARGST